MSGIFGFLLGGTGGGGGGGSSVAEIAWSSMDSTTPAISTAGNVGDISNAPDGTLWIKRRKETTGWKTWIVNLFELMDDQGVALQQLDLVNTSAMNAGAINVGDNVAQALQGYLVTGSVVMQTSDYTLIVAQETVDETPTLSDASALAYLSFGSNFYEFQDNDSELAGDGPTDGFHLWEPVLGKEQLATLLGRDVLRGTISTAHAAILTGTESVAGTTFANSTALQKTFTPKDSTRTLLVCSTLNLGTSSSSYAPFARIVMDGTAYGVGNAAGSRSRVGAAGALSANQLTECTLFAVIPITGAPGASVTVAVQTAAAHATATAHTNRTGSDTDAATIPRGGSTLIIFETPFSLLS